MSRARSAASGGRPPARNACDPRHGCITCSDEALPMRVAEVRADEDVAVCLDEAGSRHQVMIDLVGPVTAGDQLLVHAGAALARLGPV